MYLSSRSFKNYAVAGNTQKERYQRNTLYISSYKVGIYFCIYEKDLSSKEK